MKYKKWKKWFTLIELVVVIWILVVLSTIWIYSFFWYIKDANDTKRITDIQSIKISLDNYRRNHSLLYPTTEWWSTTIQIMSWSEIIANQSNFSEFLAWKVLLTKVPTDPKTKKPYLYSISRDRTSYQITATLENQNNLISYNPIINQTYADTLNLTAYVEWSFIPRDKYVLPWLLYATWAISFDISLQENLAKVILNWQSLNMAYDMEWNIISNWITLSWVLDSVSITENSDTTPNYLSCSWVLNTTYTYYNWENDVLYMPWTALNTQIWWKYKTCDWTTWEMKPTTDYYYNCANIWVWAIFDSICKWTWCATWYVPKTDGTAWCKLDLLAPQLATPTNWAYNLPLSWILSWYPVSWTNVTYEVYLWASGNTPALKTTTSSTSYNYTWLTYSTTYNWYVKSCENSICTQSVTYTFSTTADPTWVIWGSTPVDPVVSNCESWLITCTANNVVISYIWTTWTPLDWVDWNFWTSPRITDKFYGWEKTLQYKITNNSDWRAKFKIKLAKTWTTLDFINSANASFDDSNINTTIDLWWEQIANNLFWRAWNWCIYNSETWWYDVIWKTVCFITFHARADSFVSATTQTIWQFEVTNIDSLSTWSTSYTTPTDLKLKSSWFTSTALTMNMTWSWQQTLEPSLDILTDDFGTSTRIWWIWWQAYWYRKSLTYTLSNSDSQDAFFKIWFSWLNTTYIDAFWNIKSYSFPTTVIDTNWWNPDDINTFTWTNLVLDWWSNWVWNIIWKNNTCISSPIWTDIWKWYIVPKSSNCNITIYYRWDTAFPFYNKNVFSLILLNQTITDKVYTYNKTLKARAEWWMVPFQHYVQSEMLGWIKLSIETYDPLVTWYATSEMAWWICFDASCWSTVTRDPVSWVISWYAQSENFWWIKVDWVILANNWTTSWYAQSEMAWWINFNY